jgi:hypothetical protein
MQNLKEFEKIRSVLLISAICLLPGCTQTGELRREPIATSNEITKTKQKNVPKLEFEKPWRPDTDVEHKQGATDKFVKKFSPPLPLDSLLDANSISMKSELPDGSKKQSQSPKKNAHSQKKSSHKGIYRIQLLTVADFETAQDKKYSLSRILGASVDILFDAPFYKLRYGRYSSKRKAQEKLLDIKDLGLQGFVIKE